MASIGGYTVMTMDRLPEPAGHETVRKARPGVDGVSARTEGLRAPLTSVTTRTVVTTSGQVASVPASYSALKGSLVTVVDDFGNTVTNVMVEDVRVQQVTRVGMSVPIAYAIVECVWEMYRWL